MAAKKRRCNYSKCRKWYVPKSSKSRFCSPYCYVHDHYENNKEAYAQRKHDKYIQNKDEFLDRQRRYRKANRLKVNAYVNNYNAVNKERVNARVRKRTKERYANDPAFREAYIRSNYIRREDLTADYAMTEEQWQITLQFFENRCAYCDCKGKLVRDHFVPHKLGGLYIWTNMVPSCRDCNGQKSAKPPQVWLKDDPERYRRIAQYLNSRAKELPWQTNQAQ